MSLKGCQIEIIFKNLFPTSYILRWTSFTKCSCTSNYFDRGSVIETISTYWTSNDIENWMDTLNCCFIGNAKLIWIFCLSYDSNLAFIIDFDYKWKVYFILLVELRALIKSKIVFFRQRKTKRDYNKYFVIFIFSFFSLTQNVSLYLRFIAFCSERNNFQ